MLLPSCTLILLEARGLAFEQTLWLITCQSAKDDPGEELCIGGRLGNSIRVQANHLNVPGWDRKVIAVK